MQLFQVVTYNILIVLAGASAAVTVSRSAIFASLRAWSAALGLYKLIRCTYCLAHWTVLIALLAAPQGTIYLDGIVGLVLWYFSLVCLTTAIAGLLMRVWGEK